MSRIKVNVSFKEGVGYVSVANHEITRSVTALSLARLKRRLLAVALQGRPDAKIKVTLLLDSAAQREYDRRLAAAEV
jgi:hypothetical protein